MNRTFIISDTHFGHKNILKFEAEHRPFATIEAHDAELIYRWNHTVKPKDTVWHLGDVLFGRESFEILPQLNGIKKLVMGNHDHYPSSHYLAPNCFNSLHAAVQLQHVILTHIPIHPQQLQRFRGNIHGHLHSNTLDDPKYVNVSAEHHNLTPILLDKALSRLV